MASKSSAKKISGTFSGLEQLFGSKTRFALLKIFCRDAEQKFFMREIARLADNQLNAIRREVMNLESMGIIKEVETDDANKKYYKLNTNFILYNELNSLISKSELLAEKNLVSGIKRIGNVELLLLTGIFTGVESPCDLLLVGRIDKDELSRIIRKFETEFNKSISYAVLSPEEFRQRKSLTDKFLFSVLESKKIVAVDKSEEFAGSENL